jgi:photosystem II stability/assembly factor-like uncharacterized protein
MDGRRLALSLALILLYSARLRAQPPELLRTWREDAALYDVQMVSTRDAWTVGAHGTLWQTQDGGQSWSLAETGSSATFRSLCLLTDQIGWIAGWKNRGSAELAIGVLLATRDGGVSWEEIDTRSLSPLRYVKFFGLDEGVVLGEPTPDNRTGVWSTADGGKSWTPLDGKSVSGWNAIAMTAPEAGLLADREGNVSLLAGPQLLPSRLPPLKGRSIRSVTLSEADHDWLVGEGGLVMHSPSGGVVWQAPETPLPEDIRFVSDFRTVAVQGEAVWIAGNPGGLIWQSPDGGRTWTRQATGTTTPIQKIAFVDAVHGCAVGDLGVILVTDDGGENWMPARGANRHAAWMSIHARPDGVVPEVVAKISGDQGYRGVAILAIRPSNSRGAPALQPERLSEAVSLSGGSAAEIVWPLVLDVPGLELQSDKLLNYWQWRTEGRLPQTLLGNLVRQIRVWRPHVLIVEQPDPDDAASQLIYDAAMHAVDQAADGTRFVIQRELGAAAPWKVDRVLLQLRPGNSGEISVDPFELLPRFQMSGRAAAAVPRALLNCDIGTARQLGYRAIGGNAADPKVTDFFAGLSLEPGSDTRRALIPFNEQGLDRAIKSAQRHRNVIAYADRTLDDPRIAGQMIAQLREITGEMTPQQAAITLYDLFLEYRRRDQDDFAEAAAMELLHRYPDEPPAADAAHWLFQFLVSEEVAGRQASSGTAGSSAPTSTIRRAGFESGKRSAPSERLVKAMHVHGILEEHWPKLAVSPEIEFPLAALHRARGAPSQADAIYRQRATTQLDAGGPWAAVLKRELWLVQPTAEVPDGIARCAAASTKPLLDGLISDECWLNTPTDLALGYRTTAAMPDDAAPMILVSYDAEYLYVAASVPRIDGQSQDPIQTAGRQHDGDLRRHDRLSLYLDVDRDYATWFAFHVDQRGWTAESCWDRAGYDPQWFVAADADATHWRAEFAIPFRVFVSRAPQPGDAWGFALERTAPGAGVQRWQPNPSEIAGAGLGILRFE